jgi:tetratricopeptide (TPR) repeat protein
MLTIKNDSGKNLIIFVAAAMLLSACSPSGVRDLKQGTKLLEEGSVAAAIQKLRTATVLLGGTNAQAYNYLGVACHQAGQFADAQKAYERALALNPNLVEVRYNLGCLWLSQNKLEQAKGEFTAFTLRRGNSAEGWQQLGTVQLRLRDLSGAEKSFSEAIRLSPVDAEALTGLGLVRVQRGRAGEGVQLFAKAHKEHPGYAPALLNWAIVAQEQLRDPNVALQKYHEYLALKPPPENAEAVKGIVSQLEVALTPPPPLTNVVAHTVTNALKNPPPEVIHTSTPPKLALVTEKDRTATVAKAESQTNSPRPTVLTNVAKAPPLPPPAREPDTNFETVKLAPEPAFKPAADVAIPAAVPATRIETQRDEPLVVTSSPPTTNSNAKTAKRSFFQRINPINLFSSDGKPAPRRVESQSEAASSGPTPESIDPAEPVGVLGPATNAPLRYRYRSPAKPEPGDRAEAERAFAQGVQAQQGLHHSEALQAYQRATQTDPAYFEAYYNLGLVAAQTGSIQLSLNAYENALAIRPESLDARYNFALGLKQANYPIDAANELERLLALYPNDARAHLALGNLYAQQLGQPAKARDHYLKLLENDPRNPQAPAVRYWLTANPK